MRRRELRYSTRGARVNKSRDAPGSDAARHADQQGLRGRGRQGLAMTISGLSMVPEKAAGLLCPHAPV